MKMTYLLSGCAPLETGWAISHSLQRSNAGKVFFIGLRNFGKLPEGSTASWDGIHLKKSNTENPQSLLKAWSETRSA